MARKYDDLNKEELIEQLKARDRRDATKFGLVWEANEVERDKALNSDFVALDLVPEECVGDAPWRNLIIEGDNFDALRHLKMTFAGQVNCIYIDPPYNTGNQDFVYNDRFVDSNDAWRHSTWVEFMYQRLTLAKDLLTEDGVIYVSIDDHEVHALGLLMQRIFGPSGFVATFVWKRRTTPDSRNLNGISSDHEYVLAYSAGSSFRVKGRGKDLSKYSNPDNDPLGPWMSDNLTGLANAQERPNLHYELVNPETDESYPPHPARGWAYGQERMAATVKAGRILWPKSRAGRPRLKRYATDMLSDVTGFSTVLDSPGNVQATKELSQMLGPKAFQFPKPVGLILELVRQASTGSDDLILDFFAGSGTTAHAVMKLNAEDGGNRRFILVSSSEETEEELGKNICRDVCAKRVRRAIDGYGDTLGLRGDFAYLRCRRIEAGQLLEIEHKQVWTALQLIHRDELLPYTDEPLLISHVGDNVLIYVPRFLPELVEPISDAVESQASAVIYSWQPDTIRQHVAGAHVQHEAIPESLARRFGLRVET